MKKFWKKASAKAGFTLVELVVVIAVLAILAAVAYPAYTGYITRANDAKVISQVSNLLTAVESAKAIANDTNALESINIDASGYITVKITTTGDITTGDKGIGKDIVTFASSSVKVEATTNKLMLDISLDGTSYAKGMTWTDENGWVAKSA